jgi:hypothetical protein
VIPDNHDEAGLKVYPVPAKDILFFESERIINEITIYDAGGRIMQKSTPACSIIEVNLKNYARSVYFYLLKTADNRLMSGRFIIQ